MRFRNLISSFSKDKIVLLSTHIVSDVEYIADKIFLMKEGQILKEGTPEEITAQMNGLVWECEVDEKRAAEKRRQIEEINMQKSKKDAAFDDNISAVNVLSEVDRAVAIAAYENIANTFNENIIKSTIDN